VTQGKNFEKVSLPLTGVEVVDHIVTELRGSTSTPEGLLLREWRQTLARAVQSLTEPPAAPATGWSG